jgi:lysophospholipase L1-like esterase
MIAPRRIAPVIALLALAGIAATDSPTKHASIWPKPPARFLLLGDSLALGLDGPLRSELGRFVWARTHARVGATLADFRDVEPILDETKPSIVLVSLGTNDAAAQSGDYRARFAARVVDWVHAVQSTGARVVWLIPPEMPFDTDPIIDAIKRSGAAYLMAPSDLPRQPDKIHPTPAGYRAWAHRVAIQ